MAAYKAELLSHYYEDKRRPRQAWFMGRIGEWAPFAARVPRLANFLTQTPVLRAIAKRIAGVADSRELPQFATTPFRAQLAAYRGRTAAHVAVADAPAQKPVILWVDTFCENFHPEIAMAATKVLQHAGFHAVLPERKLCCGRPLYDFGLLDMAKAKLADILDSLAPYFDSDESEAAIVGLEPGCMSVFKDELLRHFPDDPRARRLASRTWMLADFLADQGYQPPRYEIDVLIHAHCHQKSLFGTQGEQTLLKRMGANWTLLDSGCCGMAGSTSMASCAFRPASPSVSRKSSIMVPDQIIPMGFARFFPSMSGAEPCTGSVVVEPDARQQLPSLSKRNLILKMGANITLVFMRRSGDMPPCR